MAIRLNHTIVAAHDKEKAAMFLTEILGLPAPLLVGPFAMVRVSDDTSLDYMDTDGEIISQHYAFLVKRANLTQIFARIRDQRLTYWADPYRHKHNEINTWDGGRGVYFDDPNGHLLEIITRPYGSGGTTTSRPHLCSHRHWDQKLTRVAALISKRRKVRAVCSRRTIQTRDMKQTEKGDDG